MASGQHEFVAACGLYCGACPIHQAGQPIGAKDLACGGCLSDDVVAIVCRNCELRRPGHYALSGIQARHVSLRQRTSGPGSLTA